MTSNWKPVMNWSMFLLAIECAMFLVPVSVSLLILGPALVWIDSNRIGVQFVMLVATLLVCLAALASVWIHVYVFFKKGREGLVGLAPLIGWCAHAGAIFVGFGWFSLLASRIGYVTPDAMRPVALFGLFGLTAVIPYCHLMVEKQLGRWVHGR